jgi:radical SAM protein with 4Fe4S-binding SPASM domain
MALGIEKPKVEKLLSDPYVRTALTSITRSFAYYGITKPLRVYAPFLVVWDFTHSCNLACKHCYSNSGSAVAGELTTEEAYAVIDQLADFGVTALAFSGGEPLCRKDFFDVASYAVKHGLYVSVATNGTLLTSANVKKLKEIGVNYVEISIDGATSQSHDTFRGVHGAFDAAITGLKNCIEANLCACVATTITKENQGELPKILELAEKMGAARFTFFNFIPTGRGKQLYCEDLTPEEREEILVFLLNKILTKCKVSILTTAPQLARVALQRQKGVDEFYMPMAHMQTSKVGSKAVVLADFIGGCGAGRLYCSISPEGDVHPCVFLPIKVGNLKNEKFEDIWLHSKVFAALRNRENLKGPCGKCTYKNVCGGCRARAYAYFGDYTASDIGCVIAKKEVENR